MSAVELGIEILLLLLLLGALPFALRLERRLSELKAHRGALDSGAAGITEAAQMAEQALARLRATADGEGRAVAERIAVAEPLRDDLRYLTERAEALADRLDALVRAARPLAAALPEAGGAPGAPVAAFAAVGRGGGSGSAPGAASGPPPLTLVPPAAPQSRAERDLMRALGGGGAAGAGR